MIVGLPGAGISAVFYLFCVLLMPFHSFWVVATGRRLRPGHWRRIARQWAIGLGIVVSLFAVGWLLAAMPGEASRPAVATLSAAEQGVRSAASLGIYAALGTLVIVLAVVQVLSLLPRHRAVAHVPQPADPSIARSPSVSE